MESSLGKDLGLGSKEQVSLDVKSFNWPSRKEVHSNSQFSMLASFSSLVGMSVEGFEKKIFSLLRKMESRKGCDVFVSREKRKLISNSRLEGRFKNWSIR